MSVLVFIGERCSLRTKFPPEEMFSSFQDGVTVPEITNFFFWDNDGDVNQHRLLQAATDFVLAHVNQSHQFFAKVR